MMDKVLRALNQNSKIISSDYPNDIFYAIRNLKCNSEINEAKELY